jgi:transcriptional regulator with XRE-family HTH domain
MDRIMETLADRIILKMNELGIDQYDLATKIGVSQPAIQKIVCGKTKEPRKMLQIAHALGTTVAWLQNGKTPVDDELPPVIAREDWISLSPKTRAFIDEIIIKAKQHAINDESVNALQLTMKLIGRSNNNHHAHA